MRITVQVAPDGSVDRSGIATPQGTKVAHASYSTLVLKVPGHQYWSRRGGPWSYAPAAFQVLKIVEAREEQSLVTFVCEEITSFDQREHGPTYERLREVAKQCI